MNYKIIPMIFALVILFNPVATKANYSTIDSEAYIQYSDFYDDDYYDDYYDDNCGGDEEERNGSGSSILMKYIRITSPVNGDTLGGNAYDILSSQPSTYPISWTSTTNGIKYVDILYSPDFGETFYEIVTGYPNTGYFDWTLPSIHSDQVIIRINAFGENNVNYGSVLSSSPFSVYNLNGTTQSYPVHYFTPARILNNCA